MKDVEITINNITHKLLPIPSEEKDRMCISCSLYYLCDNAICETLGGFPGVGEYKYFQMIEK